MREKKKILKIYRKMGNLFKNIIFFVEFFSNFLFLLDQKNIYLNFFFFLLRYIDAIRPKIDDRFLKLNLKFYGFVA
jgi:hypothetical protein